MSTPAERLRTVAQDAIKQYKAETAGGGEPPYPDWADDILVMLGRIANLEQAHQQDVERVIKERLPDGRELGINWIAVSCVAKGEIDPRWIEFNAAEVMAVYYSAPDMRPMFVPLDSYRAMQADRDEASARAFYETAVAEAAIERVKELEAERDKLRDALDAAQRSLNTIATLGGSEADLMGTMRQVRGYANSRARVARAALGQEQGEHHDIG